MTRIQSDRVHLGAPSPLPNPTPGRLGVYSRADGLDVGVVATHAHAVDFCVFTPEGTETRWHLLGPENSVWHGHIPGLTEGTRYGFRVYGPWDPDGGLFHNPAKLLLDPYARGIEGHVDLVSAVHAHLVDEDLYPTTYPLELNSEDSFGHVPLSVVVGNHFAVAPKPRVAWNDTVIYELHVKGFTKNMPDVPPALRGTYAGLAHPAAINYLKKLGVTAVELLPIHAKQDEEFLAERGLTNYWGYSTLGYFAPEPSYATRKAQEQGAQAVVDEFRGMVSILHHAGLEVILDVVYNHTCEGGDTGPSLSWRGLDSPTYYRHTGMRPVQMVDVTGTGNTLDAENPRTMQMILDSLRYWSKEMGIDGFRFDLAATLGRFHTGFTPYHPLLMAISTDTDLATDKLIAEPWDIGPGGWQTGNFPVPFAEWNDHFRDSARSFWLSDFRNLSLGRPAAGPNDLATRLSGSADMFNHAGPGHGRGPYASINLITAHDGFTLNDLTSYDHKHNLANLEENRDGTNNNHSWNHGLEGALAGGETGDVRGIVEDLFPSRRRSMRNLLTTMLISSGTPMIVAGDEFGRTQGGNNNAYCQDGPISWVDWRHSQAQMDQIDTTRWLLWLRAEHPVLRPARFCTGSPALGDTIDDLSWYAADGHTMLQSAWGRQEARVFQMLRSGYPQGDCDALVVVNGTLDTQHVTFPFGHHLDWTMVMDTTWHAPSEGGIDVNAVVGNVDPAELNLDRYPGHATMVVEPQSMVIFLSVKAWSGSGTMPA